MKIVINTCYGEFGISIEALQELVSRSAKCLRICTPKYYYGGENGWNKRHDWEKGWQRDFAPVALPLLVMMRDMIGLKSLNDVGEEKGKKKNP